MRFILLITILFFVLDFSFAQSDSIVIKVDNEAFFVKFNNFLAENIRYPERALEKRLSGKCEIGFTVHFDGTISDFVILQGINGCPECDEEALRVLKKSKKWNPATVNGKPVTSRHIAVINYKIN